MKKITFFLAFFAIIVLQSCEVNEVTEVYQSSNPTPKTKVFEVTTSFYPETNYSATIVFDRPIYSSDSILLYHLYDVVEGQDVWRLMPQTYYFDHGGALDFNYDFTRFDAKIYLAANFNLNTLNPNWTRNQTFRVVIVPNGFAKTINKNNIGSVFSALEVRANELKKIDL